jgi:16S rRNA (guanine527-N7)-methyltransferase
VKQALTEEAFFTRIVVSRETAERLRTYAALLQKWQSAINLVGPASLADPWRRHFLDSAQLFPLLIPGALLDLGCGAGFPGLVLAILGDGSRSVHLVDSDRRKIAFLREAARVTDTKVTVHWDRIESLRPFPVANITARALAPLSNLLGWATPFLQLGGQCLFLKGEKLEDELTAAAKDWKMRTERIPSQSDPYGSILRVKEVNRGRDDP